MISNRMRIEKQILLGRQTVRLRSRARNHSGLQSKAPLLYSADREGEERSAERHSKNASPLPTTSERPISVDTDAEEAFTHGSQWFYKRGRARRAPSPNADLRNEDTNLDPLSSPRMRKKWASDLLNSADNEVDSNQASAESEDKGKPNPPSLFKRLSSLHSIHLPLSPENTHDANNNHIPHNNEIWSSDTSDEDSL